MKPAPILILTQGHAGDRLGALLTPSLQRRFPEHELIGVGGDRMAETGVRLVARTDQLSAMGWTGVLPLVPKLLRAIRSTAQAIRNPVPAGVIAVDIWQPLQFLHRRAPHLSGIPHVCYLPPGPNFIGKSRLHDRVSQAFRSIVTPFEHQAILYGESGGRVVRAAHAGLISLRTELTPAPAGARAPILALLPGSRELEVRFSLPVQLAVARALRERFPQLEPVICCANDDIQRLAQRVAPEVRTAKNAREILSIARFGIICSGTAVLEAAILGCPGVVTYHGSALQRWEWRSFHVRKLAELRARGIASPYIALPNIIANTELYPEHLDAPVGEIVAAAVNVLNRDEATVRAALDEVPARLSWEDPGQAVADELAKCLSAPFGG